MKFADTTLAVIEALGTTTWTGAAIGFVATSAPTAARTINDPDTIAKLTGGTLTKIGRLAYTAGAAAVAAAALRAVLDDKARPSDIARALAGAAAIALIAYHNETIMTAMQAVQSELGGSFRSIAEDDPRRRAYRALHKRSRSVYGAALLAGVLEITLAAAR